ncbi:C40 family peptidase [Nocardioides guangzhouensis]|uniref:C40 family peptidase n=1 Tax=Nocardioides guangzhouensis TaxID=2497878 RepID=UPI001FE8E547|nr:C40 family peptidase [Nocardioides guangzhouensis]
MTGLLGIAAIVSVSLVPTTPTYADPDIDEVKARVDTLYHQAEQAQERYNDAKLALDDLEADLATLKKDEKAQQARVEKMSGAVTEGMAAQYEGQSISTTGQLVLADDPDQFLSELTTLDSFNDAQAEAVADFSREADKLDARRAATKASATELAATEKTLLKEKKKVDAKLAEAKDVLGKLEEKERERLDSASRSDTRLPNVPVSGRASAAVNYALAQVGDAYVYGAAGPDAFDCSGLTMMAWAQAGVSLPHSSSAQQGSGTPVSSGNLQPGDLVFYYQPVSHVGIYIGGGRIVHAANPSTGVTVAGVFSMPYSGAVRPG